MIRKLIKHGNSYALIIDKPILELLGATSETPFEIFTDGRSLLLKPIRTPQEEKKLADALARINGRFGDDLKRLAE